MKRNRITILYRWVFSGLLEVPSTNGSATTQKAMHLVITPWIQIAADSNVRDGQDCTGEGGP